jgi:ABC-type nitrate/sulfonate/bicarbonate transport system permease component
MNGGAEGPTKLEYWMSDHALGVVWAIAAIAVLSAVLFFFILRRAGYNPWLAILMLVPPLGLIPMYMLAFRDWPAQGATRPG